MSSDILRRHPNEVSQAIRQHRYEMSDKGIYLPGSRVFLGGALKCTDYRDNSEQFVSIDANTLLTQGLVHALNVIFPPTGGYAQITQWYIAPFSNDYTPDASLTAATFTATAGEFTAYTSSTRLALTIAAAATTATTGNTGDEAILTLNSGGPYDIYGGCIISASAKSATTGKAMAAVRLENPRIDLSGGDRLGLEYVITASDAG